MRDSYSYMPHGNETPRQHILAAMYKPNKCNSNYFWHQFRDNAKSQQHYLYGHIAHYGSLVALKGLLRNGAYLTRGFAQKLLASRLQHIFILALNLHLWPRNIPRHQVSHLRGCNKLHQAYSNRKKQKTIQNHGQLKEGPFLWRLFQKFFSGKCAWQVFLCPPVQLLHPLNMSQTTLSGCT